MIDAHSYFILITFYKIQFQTMKYWQKYDKPPTSRFRAVWIRVDSYLWAEFKWTDSLNQMIWRSELNELTHRI